MPARVQAVAPASRAALAVRSLRVIDAQEPAMTAFRPRLAAAALAVIAATTATVTWAGDDGKGFSLGLEGHGRTQPADVGLPVFAGAVAFKESRDEKAAITLGAWAGQFGLQVHAMKFRSDAAGDRVAAFYARELGRYGEVLDCRDPAARVKPPKDSDKLSCDGGAPTAGNFEYRVGTAKSFRVVSVRKDGEGSRFDMAKVDVRF